MDKINSQQKGSALIITILFGTVAVSLSLILSTFALNDFRQVSAVDEANTAKYANEAITEMALAKYDSDRNKVTACDNNDIVLGDNELIYKKIIEGGTAEIKRSNSDLAYPCEKIIETISDSNKIKTSVISYFYASKTELEFERNEVKIFTIPPNSANLKISLVEVGGEYIRDLPQEVNKVNIKVTFYINQTFLGISNTQFPSFTFDPNGAVVTGQDQTISINGSSEGQMQIRMYVESVLNDPNFISTSPAKVKVKIEPLNESEKNMFLDSTITTIEATTEYGSIRKKTITEIDRRSGTIIDQATFVLYGSGGITVE